MCVRVSYICAEIQQLLDEAGADYRDCLEKRELENRLDSLRSHLPAHVQYRLKSIIDARSAADVSSPSSSSSSSSSSSPSSSSSSLSASSSVEVLGPLSQPPLTGLLTPEEQLHVSLFKRCAPSVVHIKSVVATTNAYTLDIMEIPRGSGTGFCWDNGPAGGHIVTNYHVIQPMLDAGRAGRAKVTLADNTVLDASLVGVEPSKDLAVLRIESPERGRFQRGLHPILLGSSSSLLVGQKVLAIGNPFGLDQTLTAGLISGLGREIRGVAGNTIRGLIQTDAAINPGNSGGPLLDSSGRLIGVNTMIFSTSGSWAGIGFSIPSDTVRRVVNQLIRFGKVRKVGLGVSALPDQQAATLLRKLLPRLGSSSSSSSSSSAAAAAAAAAPCHSYHPP